MENQAVAIVKASAQKKTKLMTTKPGAYLLRSLLAGLYLSLICYLYWQLKNNLASTGFGSFIASLFFGIGLYIIVVTGSELFTSNAMYLTSGSLFKVTTWGQTAKLWCLCYMGNLIGALVFALLLWGTGALETLPVDHALFHGAEHKVEQSIRFLLCKGILANWVVCLAVWVGLHLKEEIAKFASIVLIIFIFLFLGFEHSIANMGTFTMALFAANSTVPVSGMLYNLLWVTLGNIIGGGFFIGAIYWWLNKDE